MHKYYEINTPGNNIRCKIYYNEKVQPEKAVVFCTGFAGHKDNGAAAKFAEKLLSKQKDAIVVVFNWPSHGDYVKKKLVLSDCDTYLDIVVKDAKERFAVKVLYSFATSFGGYLVLKYISEHDNPFRKIVLRCPAIDMYDVLTNTIMKNDNQLVRRDFIVNNEIQFCDITAEDMLFTICELCSAKRYVLLPNVIYYYRQNEGSITHAKKTLPEFLSRKVKALKTVIRYIEEFLSDREFFSRRPDLKYILFDMFINELLNGVMEIYMHVPAPALDAFLQKEFSDGNHKALTTLLFSMVNSYRLQLIGAHQRISQLENEIKSLKAAKK